MAHVVARNSIGSNGSRTSRQSTFQPKLTAAPTSVVKYGMDGEDRELQSVELAAFSPMRIWVHDLIFSWYFDPGIGALVLFNIMLIIFETDERAKTGLEPPVWMSFANYVLLVVYTVEVGLRLYVKRCGFFLNIMNLIDLCCVSMDLVSEVIFLAIGTDLPVLSIFRLVRLLRLARTMKVVLMLPQLALLVKSLLAALSAITWGVVLVFLIIVLWSVIAVQIIHPLNLEVASSGVYDDCPRCSRAFQSVLASSLTFVQQIIAGDSWGLVTMPIVELYPFSMCYFIMVFITIDLAIMNVILAVIVDSALRFSSEDATVMSRMHEQHFAATSAKLMRMCAEIDKDNSGILHLEELKVGIQTHEEFRQELLAMDVKEQDLEVVFKILDSDESGDVNYGEFVEELYKMKNENSHTMLVFIKYYCVQIHQNVRDQIYTLQKDIQSKLTSLLPAPTLASKPTPQPLEAKKDMSQMISDSVSAALGGTRGTSLTDELRQLREVIHTDLSKQLGDMVSAYQSTLRDVGDNKPKVGARTRSEDCGGFHGCAPGPTSRMDAVAIHTHRACDNPSASKLPSASPSREPPLDGCGGFPGCAPAGPDDGRMENQRIYTNRVETTAATTRSSTARGTM